MGSSVNGLGILLVAVLIVAGVWTLSPTAEGRESLMCPPVTIEDLFSEEEPPEEEPPQEDPGGGPAEPDPTSTTNPATASTTNPTSTSTTTTTSTTSTSSSTATTMAAGDAGTPSTSQPTAPTTQPGEATEGDPVGTTPDTSVTSTSLSPEAPETSVATAETPASTTTTTEPACDTPFVYPMVFPVLGDGHIASPFGAPRDGGRRHHHGNDLVAEKLQPVVAVAEGTISRIGDSGISGHRVHLRHDDGWSTLYIHLNNDTAGTDDGNGIGVHPGLSEGDRVEAGQVIGWNGDSGNAEDTVPHLHFELQDPGGTPVDPRASLEAARQVGEEGFTGPFTDLRFDPENVDPMIRLLSRGTEVWCGSETVACPDDPARRDHLAAWLSTLTELPALECRDDPCETITEADVARAIAWDRLREAYAASPQVQEGIPDGRVVAPPPRPPSHPDELDRSEAHLLLGGRQRCLPLPGADRLLTRRQAAEAVVLYLGWSDVDYCLTSSRNR